MRRGACPANTMGWEATARARPTLAPEVDGAPAGFVMARVDFGEFGRPEPAAVIDTIGVDPGHGGLGVFLYFVAGSWCDALS